MWGLLGRRVVLLYYFSSMFQLLRLWIRSNIYIWYRSITRGRHSLAHYHTQTHRANFHLLHTRKKKIMSSRFTVSPHVRFVLHFSPSALMSIRSLLVWLFLSFMLLIWFFGFFFLAFCLLVCVCVILLFLILFLSQQQQHHHHHCVVDLVNFFFCSFLSILSRRSSTRANTHTTHRTIATTTTTTRTVTATVDDNDVVDDDDDDVENIIFGIRDTICDIIIIVISILRSTNALNQPIQSTIGISLLRFSSSVHLLNDEHTPTKRCCIFLNLRPFRWT